MFIANPYPLGAFVAPEPALAGPWLRFQERGLDGGSGGPAVVDEEFVAGRFGRRRTSSAYSKLSYQLLTRCQVSAR